MNWNSFPGCLTYILLIDKWGKSLWTLSMHIIYECLGIVDISHDCG
jgi:hypothetical protein